MPARSFSDEEYRSAFIRKKDGPGDHVNERALERALDIRKFEIDLYWRRAAYFWTLIAATFAGFVAIQASDSQNKANLSILLCTIGIVFSFGWLCVNRGSKFWQENWEYHVDMLEDEIHGPLYKVILSRRKPKGVVEWILHILTGPWMISVSKVNQLISLFVTIIWIALLIYSFQTIRPGAPVWLYVFMIALSCLTCAGFVSVGRTYGGGYWHRATVRTAKINNNGQASKK